MTEVNIKVIEMAYTYICHGGGGGVSICSTIEYEICSTLVQSNIFKKKKKEKKNVYKRKINLHNTCINKKL